MDWQIIIVAIIVLAALGYALFRTFRYLKNPLRKCDGCSMNCGGCSLEELKKQIEAAKKNVPKADSTS